MEIDPVPCSLNRSILVQLVQAAPCWPSSSSEPAWTSIKKLSEAAEWEVPTIPNASEYVVFTTEIQSMADEMDKKAKEKNIDGATLAYLRLTMNCMSCHKYVPQASK
jgi:hypothetical protein